MEQNNNDDILKQVNEKEDEVKKLNKEIETLQSECKHQGEYHINFDEEKSIKKFCSMCKKDIGYASREESNNFLRPRGYQNT